VLGWQSFEHAGHRIHMGNRLESGKGGLQRFPHGRLGEFTIARTAGGALPQKQHHAIHEHDGQLMLNLTGVAWIRKLSEAFDPSGQPRVEGLEPRFRIGLPSRQFLRAGGIGTFGIRVRVRMEFLGVGHKDSLLGATNPWHSASAALRS
jgi:hypothetical protein